MPANPRHATTSNASRDRWRRLRRVRRLVQIVAFLLFVVLLVLTQQRSSGSPWAGLFFRLDPLAGISAMLAARAWLPLFALGMITIVVTLSFGRVWCGWICPMGTLLEWLRWPGAERTGRHIPDSLRLGKYALLGVILGMAALGSLTLLILDPIGLLTRGATVAVLPALDAALIALQSALANWEPTQSVGFWMQQHAQGSVYPPAASHYAQAIAIVALLAIIVALNVLADRFWCRYLCPLGGLLALLARIQVLRPQVTASCTTCGACNRSCRLGAITPATGSAETGERQTPHVVTAECTMCLDCLTACSRGGAMTMGTAAPRLPQQSFDPGRRAFLTAAGLGAGALAGAGAAAALGINAPAAEADARLIRPPGAQDEERFTAQCIRCGECLLVCPTAGLQPALLQGGLGAIWTPVLTPRLGYCDYTCNACGHVCPSGAIPALDLPVKQTQVIGRAAIDRSRCLPWALGQPCLICEEMCPVPEKAIVMDEPQLVTRDDGTQDTIARPYVVNQRCIGCGICENKCPVEGTAAIVVRRSSGAQGRQRRGQST